eukprot:CAMPEP_0113872134 /NCGR_PEP_ID=MMETSP0780_2-20120614/3030_1 /TAXON_ID=652834 /ORGANISM="Palpitomonas bilix" /LENGTH=192 /DNA_ID=CAMNT_0000857603 /DNA_START=109 /DNA_END=687 /DNA_ORIENTATION=+ /assembly_acc=CAM_ASM_000599
MTEEREASAEELGQLRDVYGILAATGGGRLGTKEVKRFLSALGDDVSDEMVADIICEATKSSSMVRRKREGTGEVLEAKEVISFENFSKFMRNPLYGENHLTEDAKYTFKLLDPSGSGYLDRSKVEELILSLYGTELSEKELGSLIKEMDKDGDGLVSMEDFLASTVKADMEEGTQGVEEVGGKTKEEAVMA